MSSTTENHAPVAPVAPGPPAPFRVGIIRWSRFVREIGIDHNTAARWRKEGRIKPTINIDGFWFVRREDVETFLKRAEAGEFSKSRVPRRTKHEKAVQ